MQECTKGTGLHHRNDHAISSYTWPPAMSVSVVASGRASALKLPCLVLPGVKARPAGLGGGFPFLAAFFLELRDCDQMKEFKPKIK